MKKMALVLLIGFFCINTHLQAMQEYPQEATIDLDNSTQLANIDDIPKHCINLVKQLLAQKEFDGYDSLHTPCKVLQLDNWDDCRICELLTEYAKQNTKNVPYIYSFGCGNNQLYDRFRQNLNQGITIWLYEDHKTCSLDELMDVYKKIIEEIKKGWYFTSLTEYANILHKESEQEWFLLIKKKSFSQEDTLIRFLASKLNLRNAISCHNEWKGYEHQDKLYLWIKKDSLTKVHNSFNCVQEPLPTFCTNEELIENLLSQFSPALNNEEFLATADNITTQLVNTIGTLAITNKKDIPTIVKYIKELSAHNQQFDEFVNSEHGTIKLIDTLSRRFKISQPDSAAALDTQGSRLWMQHRLEQSGEYDLFKIVQQIRNIAEEERKDIEKSTGTSVQSGEQGWPDPNPFYCQTKQGFMLDASRYPSQLYTPWGEIELFGGGCGSSLGFLALYQSFLKRFKTSFVKITESFLDRDKVKFYMMNFKDIDLKKALQNQEPEHLTNLYNHIFQQEIPKDTLATLEGQDVVITSNYCGWDSVYNIHAIEGQSLPKPELMPHTEYRSYDEVKKTWKIMSQLYAKECRKDS